MTVFCLSTTAFLPLNMPCRSRCSGEGTRPAVPAGTPRHEVEVFDEVFDDPAQLVMALATSSTSDGVYRRTEGLPSTPMHRMIESLLRSLGDTSTKEVEYWGRRVLPQPLPPPVTAAATTTT